MRFKSKRNAALRSVWLLILAIAGCGPTSPTNLSPTAGQDPDRYQRAIHESEQKARKDQEDERKAFQAKGRNMPNL